MKISVHWSGNHEKSDLTACRQNLVIPPSGTVTAARPGHLTAFDFAWEWQFRLLPWSSPEPLWREWPIYRPKGRLKLPTFSWREASKSMASVFEPSFWFKRILSFEQICNTFSFPPVFILRSARCAVIHKFCPAFRDPRKGGGSARSRSELQGVFIILLSVYPAINPATMESPAPTVSTASLPTAGI